MDALTFISEIVKAVAWPLSVLTIALIFRKQLAQILKLLIRIRYGDFEFEFDREFSKLEAKAQAIPISTSRPSHESDREKLLRLAAVSPQSAIVEAWRMVENRLVEVAHQHRLKLAPAVWAMPMVLTAFLQHAEILTEAQSDLLPNLRALRDKVAHHPKDNKVSMDEAIRYSDLALQLVASIPDKTS